jgi:hypothetical protein
VDQEQPSCESYLSVRNTRMRPFRWLAASGLPGTFTFGLSGLFQTGSELYALLTVRIVEGHIVEHWALPDFLSLFWQLGATISSPEPHALPSSDVERGSDSKGSRWSSPW